jgi:predicted metalloprotease with PDZ domain
MRAALSPIGAARKGQAGAAVAQRRDTRHHAAMRFPVAAVLAAVLLTTTPLDARQVSPASVTGSPGTAATYVVPAADVPAPVDAAYPGGTIDLDVDASDVVHGLFAVTETIPLAARSGAGTITLLYPQWLQGNHAPRGPLNFVGGLELRAGGRPLDWRRDPVDVYAIHVDLPAGADKLVARFTYTSPLDPSQGRVAMTQAMLDLQWEKVSLYPAGYFARQIRMRPSATLPAGWNVGTALDGGVRDEGGKVTWGATDYETLTDSPVIAGANYRRWDLTRSVSMSAVADAAGQPALRPAELARFTALVDEATLVFGPPPFDRYEFLVTLSDYLGVTGLEHQRSSEIPLDAHAFTAWDEGEWDRNVIAHEFVHSWNGKYRRPEGLWVPDFRQPTDNRLLWVYEGQTQFWGLVLAARSGLQGKQMVLDLLARSAGDLSDEAGRGWRSLGDTTFDPIVSARRPRPFASFTRGEEYYTEGSLVWLEIDQIIRAGTGGARGLDDFARSFFAFAGRHDGAKDGDGSPHPKTYTRADVVAGLQAVYPYDWEAFLTERIDRAGLDAPLAGIEKGGYRLVWRDEPNSYDKARMMHDRELNLTHSIGVTLDGDGRVTGTRWGSAAFKAGVVTGTRITAINATPYSAEVMRRAITEAKGTRRPLQLLIKREDQFQTVSLDYHDGLRWPWLERADGAGSTAETGLDRLLAPRRAPVPAVPAVPAVAIGENRP